MSDQKTKKLVLAALLAALCCVATMVIQIPSPANGFVNLGDCFVLLAAWLLGPWYGAAAAGIGSMLADLLAGYAHYAPGTLVIKALMALVAALIFRKMTRKKTSAMVVSSFAAEFVMVGGYFLYAMLLLGKGIGAAASIPGNLVQGAAGMVASVILMGILRKTELDKKLI
ncbi:MAG: ECF transporter S component [Oscillibacter sp.]|nr:ECF transporter S component [Oscillibacter sp.]